MFILFGEQTHSTAKPVGVKPCPVCASLKSFNHITETNYFSIFGIRLLPIEKIANYWQCEECNNPFNQQNLTEPSHYASVRLVLAYLQVGYSMQNQMPLVNDICAKVCGFGCTKVALNGSLKHLETHNNDIFETMRDKASNLNMLGKQAIIEAAFVMTNACCEIQYEDRLRVNLIANALGVSLEFVNAVVEYVHAQKCYGIHRLLPTREDIS